MILQLNCQFDSNGKTEIQVTLSPKTFNTTSSHSTLNTAYTENKTNCSTYNSDLDALIHSRNTLTDIDREMFLLSKWCPSKEFEFPNDPKDKRNLRFQVQ